MNFDFFYNFNENSTDIRVENIIFDLSTFKYNLVMEVKYKGQQNGISTIFTLRIIGNNLSKSSSNYQIDLLVGESPLPIFTTLIHQSLSNCLKEIYLFRKHNNIKFDADSEKVASKLVPYDLVLYNYNKHALFM